MILPRNILSGVVATILLMSAIWSQAQKPAALLMQRSAPAIPLLITNGVKVLEYTGQTNPLTGQPQYIQIYPPPNTNAIQTGWVSFTWQPAPAANTATNLIYKVIERSTNLVDWTPYEALPPSCTNLIDPNRGGNWFYRISTNAMVVKFPAN